MPIVVYVAVMFLLLFIVATFWFQQSSQRYSPVESRPLWEHNVTSLDDAFLFFGIRQLENFSDKGKRFLFVASFLLILEFFVFLSYLLENAGFNPPLNTTQYAFLLGALTFFFLCVGTILIAIRLMSASKLTSSETLFLGKSLLEQKIQAMTADQKKQFSVLLAERSEQIQAIYTLGVILISSAITLLLVWLTGWLLQTLQ